MITRYLAVLSGIHTTVAHKIGPQLRSKGVDVSFADTEKGIGSTYFSNLLNRTIVIANRIQLRQDIRLLSMLVSCIADPAQIGLEHECFFPALRRLSLRPSLRKDIALANTTATLIIDGFQSSEYVAIAKTALPHKEPRLLLPIRNTKLHRLANHYKEIFELKADRLSHRLERDISRLKSGEGHCIKGVYFKGAINDGTHPVRRCTDSPRCDLQAMMRFGVSQPERFEFDVSCETGVAGKSFFLCDGSSKKIPSRASHLNMRINDDFWIGTKQ